MSVPQNTQPILDLGQLEGLLGLECDPVWLSLVKASAPKQLDSIAHYAACWGVSDDGERSSLIGRAPDEAIQNLRHVVALHEDELDRWLAGPEAAGPEFSDAYIAYSAMRMASDRA